MSADSWMVLLKYVGYTALIMVLIALVCILTPKIARRIEKKHPSLAAKEEDMPDPSKYEVKDPYGVSKLKDYDLNNKIYNEDIYGVDFKHGKNGKRKK